MLYATMPIQAIQSELRLKTAPKASCANYDALIEQYAQALKIGLQSFSSAVVYVTRGAK